MPRGQHRPPIGKVTHTKPVKRAFPKQQSAEQLEIPAWMQPKYEGHHGHRNRPELRELKCRQPSCQYFWKGDCITPALTFAGFIGAGDVPVQCRRRGDVQDYLSKISTYTEASK
jgi:hypothetical protein